MRLPPPGFHSFDEGAPDGDIEEAIANCPTTARVKGMFNTDLQKQIRAVDSGHAALATRYTAFLDYPARDYLELIVQTAEVCHPNVSRNEAIRRTGLKAFPVFAASSIGRVVFSLLNNDPARVVAAAPKAYKLSVRPFEIDIFTLDDESMHCAMDVVTFMYTYNIGVWEGAFTAIDVDGRVYVKRDLLFRAEFFITW